MSNQIFKKEDRVFDINFGWGVVKSTTDYGNFPIGVDFGNGFIIKYTIDGKLFIRSIFPTLSFTEYKIGDKINQERPINNYDYIGKWGRFWNYGKEDIIIDKLIYYHQSHDKPFSTRHESFDFFEPLSDEQLEMLRLK